MPVRVLIVDDSALVRKLLTEILSADPEIEVVDTAFDPFVARDKIKALNPDMITLDVEMPRMDGLAFLENLMRLRPMPVLMVSSLTEQGAEVTLQALALGAVDFVAKPKIDVANGLNRYADVLRSKVKQVARARVSALRTEPPADGARPAFAYRTTDQLIAIGASTGGVVALRELLATMPPNSPPIVIAQHIPSQFSGPFAERLDKFSRLSVSEATDGQMLMPGHAYVAPGNRHLRVVRDGARWRCRLGDDEQVSGHRPSVDVLFESVAKAAGANATGALLTGMGDDGARGMLMMRQAGAHTIAQDQATSVVWGMPGAAVAMDAAVDVLPLAKIGAALLAPARKLAVAAN